MGDVSLALYRLPQPTIAKVRGVAVGAGLNMALLCDLVVAGDTARFSEIFARRGLTIDFGGSWVLPRRIGLHRAKEMTLLAEIIDAKEAAEMVLLDRATINNGSLMVVAGSHKWNRLEHYADTTTTSYKQWCIDVPTLQQRVKEEDIRHVTGEPGDVLFFDCNLVHGSNHNMSPLPRNTFIPGGDLWIAIQRGGLNADSCGHGEHRGLWFVAVNVVRDHLALNGRLTSAWDGWRAATDAHKAAFDSELKVYDELARKPDQPATAFAHYWLRG